MAGPLAGLRVVEMASEFAAYAGKLVADLGAEVVLVEPPAGHPTRGYPPFAGDVAGPERSLFFWHYNANKLGVTIDVESDGERQRFRDLVAKADVLIEAEPPGRLARLGLAYNDLRQTLPALVIVSVTPFGQSGPRVAEHATDLTLLATGGPVWSCGYDDHSLPPVRGGGGQAGHIASHFAVMSLLVALLARHNGGGGQHIDVNMNAAANVTTEFASYGWLAARSTVQRQTGRHASPSPTRDTQVQCADGRYLNTGVPPRRPAEFAALSQWLADLGLLEDFGLAPLLEMGADYEYITLQQIAEDPLIGEIFAAGRDAVNLLASKLPAYEVFRGLQERGIPCGIVYSPEETMADPHFVARGFPVAVHHEDRGDVGYPGAPYRFTATPWELRHRAPHLGEHNDLFGLSRRRPT